MLKSYSPVASVDFTAFLQRLVHRKDTKHSDGTANARRVFLAATSSTLGSFGHPEFWKWYDDAWTAAIVTDRANGGDGQDIIRAKDMCLADLHAIITDYSAQLAATNKPTPPRRLRAPRQQPAPPTQAQAPPGPTAT